jgi:hypothetical protein
MNTIPSHTFEMRTVLSFSLSILLYALLARAQFQFFEQMFHGGGHQQQHQSPQNAPSDSSRYQQSYDSSESYSMIGLLEDAHSDYV